MHLGQALLAELDPEKEAIDYYIKDGNNKIFGTEVSYVKQQSFHKFMMPSLKGYDIWHSNFQGTNYFPFNRNIKIVLTIHDLNFIHETNRADYKKKNELKRLQKKIDRADKIVTISKFVLDDLNKYFDLKDKDTEVIYNGCNLSGPSLNTESLQKLDGAFIFTIGTIVEKKNFHVLPALLIGNEFKLVIAGIVYSESYKAQIINVAEKFGVQERLIFTGKIDENQKCWYLENCKAFVFPSLMEGFGLPVIEAMYYGAAIFLSNLTSLPEIGGEDSYYFKSFDAEQMQKTLVEGLADFSKNEVEKKKALKDRAAQFSWKKAAEQYLRIYRSF
jgi:glycosyltransferase involved in cell wall biosynthesis